jgi:Ca2+-binding EF-hand superfamily protein
MHYLRLSTLAILIFAVAGSRADDKQGKAKGKNNDVDREVDALLRRLDTNKDGKISRDEAAGRPLAKAFSQLDKNKDGYLDRIELIPWAQRIATAGPKQAGKGQPGAAIAQSSIYDFDALDKDADGRLTREELQGTTWADAFDKIDTNKDGKIDRKEFETYARQLVDGAKTDSTKTDKPKKN